MIPLAGSPPEDPRVAGAATPLDVIAPDAPAARIGVVEARQVSKWYGQVIGLNDVTVTVPAGVTGLLGPNGAGKSTFMKLMTGQLKPSKGSITMLGEPIWGNPGIFFRIGFCPEQDAFYDRMTGLEWITALVRLNGFGEKAADEAARRALAIVELLDAADKKIGSYSKGMRQRVKLAQAIVHDPELLVLDEPTSGVDPLARAHLWDTVHATAESGAGVLITTHYMDEAEQCDRLVIMVGGRIAQEGSVASITAGRTSAVTHSRPVIRS
jgi:ABC-2 type transport system ATP-binding protein